jgi:hypothetical protein
MTAFVTAVLILMGGELALPGSQINQINSNWASTYVDTGRSCFTRVGGEPLIYESPTDFSLDPLCNFRLSNFKIIRR